MTEKLSAAQVQDALPGWRVIGGKAHATFRTGTFAAGCRFLSGVTERAELAGHHPDVDLRYPFVHISLTTHDAGGLTSRDVDLARQITELAESDDIPIDVSTPQVTEIAIDAIDIPAVKPFWRAVFDYADAGDIDLVDPQGIGPTVWFQAMDEPRQQRNRIHLDVHVPHDRAEDRVAAALDAGGHLISDADAPSFWVLGDAEGNEACVCTWQGRSGTDD